jgi:glycosyltransferase involved in cell wall biosynthesis
MSDHPLPSRQTRREPSPPSDGGLDEDRGQQGLEKVLLLAYFFPPAGGSASLRSAKFAKYLPEYGWNAVVVTAGKGQTSLSDESLLEDVPSGTRVHHVRSFDPHRFFRQSGKSASGRWRVLLLTQLRRIGKWLLSLLMVPDEFLFWAFKAYFVCSRVIRSERPSVVLSTSAPNSSHIIGFLLKRKFELPWVADLRDEWADDPWKGHPTPLHRWLDRKLERWILSRADAVVTVTGGIGRHLQENLGRDVVVIENGYDEDDVRPLPDEPFDGDAFELTYLGSLYDQITPADVLACADELVGEGSIPRAEIRLNFIGKISIEIAGVIHRYSKKLLMRTTGHLSHREALTWISGASALLLIVWNKNALTGKLFEYLACGKPILAYVRGGGEAAALLASAGCRWIVSYGDRQALKAALLSMHGEWRRKRLRAAYRGVERFSRKNQARRLAELLAGAKRRGPKQAAPPCR